MTFAIVESSSGAASAAATKPASVSAVAGSTSMPPTTVSTACSRNWNRVATPKLPPPPRIAQKRSGSCSASTAQVPAVRGHDLGGEQAVDRQAVLADEVADAAAEREAADPDRAGVAEPVASRARRPRGDLAARSAPSRPTRSVRSGSSASPRMRARSSTMPPSHTPCPATL